MPTPKLVRDARDFIAKMQPKQAKQVLLRILDLCQDPNPPDAKLLHLRLGRFLRVDSGGFRIVYRVEADVIEIVAVGKRNDDEIYRELARKDIR